MGKIINGSFLNEAFNEPTQEGLTQHGVFNPNTGRTNYGLGNYENIPMKFGWQTIDDAKSIDESSEEKDWIKLFEEHQRRKRLLAESENNDDDDPVKPPYTADMKYASDLLGYNNKPNPIISIMSGIPGISGAIANHMVEPGQVLSDGSVVSGGGGSNDLNQIFGPPAYNVFTGQQVRGNVFGNEFDTPINKELGTSPASSAGLKTYYGSASIADMLNRPVNGVYPNMGDAWTWEEDMQEQNWNDSLSAAFDEAWDEDDIEPENYTGDTYT